MSDVDWLNVTNIVQSVALVITILAMPKKVKE